MFSSIIYCFKPYTVDHVTRSTYPSEQAPMSSNIEHSLE